VLGRDTYALYHPSPMIGGRDMKAAGLATGAGALLLLAMCQKSPTSITAAALADPAPATQPVTLDDDRSTVRLVRGARLEILERRGAWAKVSPTGEACWIAAAQIDDTPAPDRAPTALYAPSASAAVPLARRRASAAAGRPRRSTGLSSGGSCPCGSGNICIGPRGGRYCITSGGNKRYGM
jgi:hypothetical protein